MAKIDEIIPPQAFENIRDRIAEILIDELNNQFVLTYNPEIDATVFVEKFINFDETDLPAINVSLGRGNTDNKNAMASDGSYRYFIDVYTRAKTSPSGPGDTLATKKAHKIMGLVRYILEHPEYVTLGFARPSILNTLLESMSFQDPTEKDGNNIVMGRSVFMVKATESENLIVPNLIEGFETSVKIDESSVGYVFSKNP